MRAVISKSNLIKRLKRASNLDIHDIDYQIQDDGTVISEWYETLQYDKKYKEYARVRMDFVVPQHIKK